MTLSRQTVSDERNVLSTTKLTIILPQVFIVIVQGESGNCFGHRLHEILKRNGVLRSGVGCLQGKKVG